MNIYLITHNEEGWDYCLGHIIAANNEDEVKYLAKHASADEGKDVWDTADIIIYGNYVGTETKPFIILTDFNRG
jgi:hypothetical protein